MRGITFAQASIISVLMLVPVLGVIGWQGARIQQLGRALEGARHAGAAMDGALGACRLLRDGAEDPPAAAREVVGLTLG